MSLNSIVVARAGSISLHSNSVGIDKQKMQLQTQVIKMSMNAISYTFSGKKTENVNHFAYNLLNYCKNNKITNDIIINLLLNGTFLKADAFNYIELEEVEIGKQDELSDEKRLNGILKLLSTRYRCENLVLKLKSQIKALKQVNNELIKDYLIKGEVLFDKLTLELRIARKLGQEYKSIDEFERADYVIAGMQAGIADKVMDKAVDSHGTARIKYVQLKNILVKFEKKELYLKSLERASSNISGINNINQQYPSPTKQQLKSQMQSLREEINFIKLGGQRLYNRTPGGGTNGNGNDESSKRWSLNEKKENGQCKFGPRCKFGLRCRFLHTQAERDSFFKNNIGRGRGGFNSRRGRGGFGNRGGGRGRFGNDNKRGGGVVQINAIEEKKIRKNNSINIANLDEPADF